VIGFENDTEQTTPLTAIWTKYESDFKSNGKFGWSEQEPAGIFGGMHFDRGSNLSNYKNFLETLAAEDEGVEDGKEEASSAISSTPMIKGPTCGVCGGSDGLDPLLHCAVCDLIVCGPCWCDTVRQLNLPKESAVACCEEHLPRREVVLETQPSQNNAETFAASALF
jgi:hypothetical protein